MGGQGERLLSDQQVFVLELYESDSSLSSTRLSKNMQIPTRRESDVETSTLGLFSVSFAMFILSARSKPSRQIFGRSIIRRLKLKGMDSEVIGDFAKYLLCTGRWLNAYANSQL